MNGSLATARSRLGMLYSWSGRYDEGIAEAERGVELDPNSGEANMHLAVVLRYAGRQGPHRPGAAQGGAAVTVRRSRPNVVTYVITPDGRYSCSR